MSLKYPIHHEMVETQKNKKATGSCQSFDSHDLHLANEPKLVVQVFNNLIMFTGIIQRCSVLANECELLFDN